jgi:hypothetical protein
MMEEGSGYGWMEEKENNKHAKLVPIVFKSQRNGYGWCLPLGLKWVSLYSSASDSS